MSDDDGGSAAANEGAVSVSVPQSIGLPPGAHDDGGSFTEHQERTTRSLDAADVDAELAGGGAPSGASDAGVPLLTPAAALDKIGLGRFHWRLLLVAGLGWGADAMWEEVTPVILPQLEIEWGASASSTVLGLLVAGQFAGMALGSIGWGVLSDKIGRQGPFRYILLVSGVSGIIAALSPSWWILLVCLFVNGIGIGGNLPVDGAMFVEFAPAIRRGSMLALLSLMYTSGSQMATSIAWALLPSMPNGGWRLMLVLCGMATMLLSALRFRYGETPIYLHQTGRVAEARASLDDVVAANGTHVPPFKLAQPSVSGASGMYADAAQQLRHRSRSRGGETGQELTQTLTQHDQFGAAAGDGSSAVGSGHSSGGAAGGVGGASGASKGASFWQLVDEIPLLKKTAWLLWTAWFFGVFGYIGLNSFLLILLERRGIFSGGDLYQDTFLYALAGLGGTCSSCSVCLEAVPAWSSLCVCMVLRVAGAIAGVFAVETALGRKGTIVVSTALACLCLIGAGIATGDFMIVLLAALANCCFQTMCTFVWHTHPRLVATTLTLRYRHAVAGLTTYTPEVFPTAIRTSGTGIANMSARVAGMLSPIVCGALLDVSEGAVLVLCGSLMAATATCAMLLPIETRGRDLS